MAGIMTLPVSVATFFVIWWIVLFAILPWGVRTQDEDESTVPGTNPSSPMQPWLLRKALVTTVVAAAVFVLIYWLVEMSGLTLDDVPFGPRFSAVQASSAS